MSRPLTAAQIDSETRARLRRTAREYRNAIASSRSGGALPEFGFVMVADHFPVGWCRDLPSAEEWCPGVIAVPVQGNIRLAVDGDRASGAGRWEVIL